MTMQYVASVNVDESTPQGKMVASILATLDQYYSDNLSHEVKLKMQQKSQLGGTPGQAPLGYLNIRRRVGGVPNVATVEVDGERGPLVRLMFEEYSTGNYTITSLTNFINDLGLTMRPTRKYPDSRPVSRTAIHKMLRNPYYCGFVVWKGAQYPGRHEGLVPLDLFQRVQDLLDGKGRRGGGWTHDHYLKGTVFCSNCESRLGFTIVTGKGGEYEYFYCLGRQEGNGCELPYLPVADIEQAVVDHYHHVQLTPERAAFLQERLLGHFSRVKEAAAREAVRHRARISKLKRAEEKLLEAFTADAISLDLMRRKQKELQSDFAAAERHLREQQQVADRVEVSTERILHQAEHCYESYRNSSDEGRRTLN